MKCDIAADLFNYSLSCNSKIIKSRHMNKNEFSIFLRCPLIMLNIHRYQASSLQLGAAKQVEKIRENRE